MKTTNLNTFMYFSVLFMLTFSANAQNNVIEEVIVTAEKRSESLQDISQSVTAISDSDIESKNIETFVDLSAIVPGLTVAKNEGYKTVISIRGVGNETNQNAIAAPSVAFHMDGIFIASPFSLQTDFIDIDRIEVLRGPQGTLFGQNSTGGAINVISKKPVIGERSGRADITLGSYNLTKLRTSQNFPINDNVATRLAVSVTERDGFSKNIFTGQDLDDANNLSVRSDWLVELDDLTSLRVFGQYFEVDRNGAAIRGIDDQTLGMRKLSQDTISNHELSSFVLGAIYEKDLGFANLKAMASVQEDDISVTRDNDRHNYGDSVLVIPGLEGTTYQRAEFTPETSLVETKTFEVNLVSNEPLWGSLDWTVGAFYMEHDIENHIRGYRDNNNDGVISYECSSPLAIAGACYEHDYGIPGRFDVFAAEWDFVTDAFPSRESFSIYGQTTYSLNESTRIVSGLRYSEDTFSTNVTNFFNVEEFSAKGTVDKVTGKIVGELDLDEDTMAYASYTKGFKPGGSNLTFGYPVDDEQNFGAQPAPQLIYPIYKSEIIDAFELGLKTDLMEGRMRANVSAFMYDYENLQFQSTDPDVYRGGVANIPESEMSGVELELIGILSDSLSMDLRISTLDTEITADYEALDNIKSELYFFGEEPQRYALRENIKGNRLAKSPEFTANLGLQYNGELKSGVPLRATAEVIHRGDFQQRVFNSPFVDQVDSYTIVNLTTSIEISDTSGVDFMILNASDKDGVNSAMTDVFGVAGTGIELIPPRQFIFRVRKNY